MDIEKIRKYCLEKNGSLECFPFDEVTLVFKVKNKMFGLLTLDENPVRMNLKCDPERAIELREMYDSILPGWHMNKKYWNTVILDGKVPLKLVFEMIDESYKLVRGKSKV